MTFNIRRESDDDKNSFINRKQLIKTRIEHERPQVICFQEVMPEVLKWLKQMFPQYYFIGCGRDAKLSDESMVVAFLREEFNLISMETFWLSETPNIPGSRYEEQSICPRTCTTLLMNDLSDGSVFRIYNTHLDHEGSNARYHGIKQILNKIEQDRMNWNVPVILCGDFNALPSSPEILACTSNDELEDCTKNIEGTFHDFGCLSMPEKIDYIFIDKGFSCRKCGLYEDCVDGIYLSDHYPIFVELDK